MRPKGKTPNVEYTHDLRKSYRFYYIDGDVESRVAPSSKWLIQSIGLDSLFINWTIFSARVTISFFERCTRWGIKLLTDEWRAGKSAAHYRFDKLWKPYYEEFKIKAWKRDSTERRINHCCCSFFFPLSAKTHNDWYFLYPGKQICEWAFSLYGVRHQLYYAVGESQQLYYSAGITKSPLAHFFHLHFDLKISNSLIDKYYNLQQILAATENTLKKCSTFEKAENKGLSLLLSG